MSKFKYFTYNEFDCKSGNGKGIDNMQDEFICLLDEARSKAGVPFIINSGYRTPEYNKQLIKQGFKASENSSHTKGIACDIKVENTQNRYKILKALIEVGFKRIGIAKNFIHCDIDYDKHQNLIWTYY
tara:strand:+ start:2891 stop:3274 length:384 start_codon:yes stop_codon:yes gene_type:complete